MYPAIVTSTCSPLPSPPLPSPPSEKLGSPSSMQFLCLLPVVNHHVCVCVCVCVYFYVLVLGTFLKVPAKW